MSKTGSFIIRHEFVQAWTDKGAARTFVFKTIERLKEYFHLQEPDEYFEYEEDDFMGFWHLLNCRYMMLFLICTMISGTYIMVIDFGK